MIACMLDEAWLATTVHHLKLCSSTVNVQTRSSTCPKSDSDSGPKHRLRGTLDSDFTPVVLREQHIPWCLTTMAGFDAGVAKNYKIAWISPPLLSVQPWVAKFDTVYPIVQLKHLQCPLHCAMMTVNVFSLWECPHFPDASSLRPTGSPRGNCRSPPSWQGLEWVDLVWGVSASLGQNDRLADKHTATISIK